MQERAFELDAESEAEPVQAEAVDLGAITARTLVAVGELDKPDFHAIGGAAAGEIPDAAHVVIEGGRPPALARAAREHRAHRAGVPLRLHGARRLVRRIPGRVEGADFWRAAAEPWADD